MKDGGPAYPIYKNLQYEGMSLRDWFAGMAMKGMMAGRYWETASKTTLVTEAYKIADGMIKGRENEY